MGRCVHEADEKWGGESKGADEKWGGESVTPCHDMSRIRLRVPSHAAWITLHMTSSADREFHVDVQ